MKIALIILTLGGTGNMQLALSEAESMEDCAAKADVVEQILSGAGYAIEAMRCGETDLVLTPYEHGRGEADMRWTYHITLKGAALEDGFELRPAESGNCQADAGAGQYCAISAQGQIAQ